MRLNQITTKTGDNGKTFLNQQSLPKNHPQIEALGAIDELNSFLGLLRAHLQNTLHDAFLQTIQQALFALGRDCALPTKEPIFPQEWVLRIEAETALLQKKLSALPEFILPAGNQAACLAHVCRSVARRAERALVAIGMPNAFLNRLSDYLFCLARTINTEPEVLWQRESLA